MRMRFVFLLICILGFHYQGTSQSEKRIEGQFIIHLKNQVDIDHFLNRVNHLRNSMDQVKFKAKISQRMNLWLIEINPKEVNEETFLKQLKANPLLHAAQYNHRITARETIPNDEKLVDQWYLYNTGQNDGTVGADINMINAWDITTGGTSATGDEIVVAIIDNGYSRNHPDLVENLWVNTDEIPDNGIDDDLNGYMDDYLGYNIDTDNGDITNAGDHGTEVAGIIGSSGNDNTGMVGVNWQIKMMNLQKDFSSLTEADVLEAYGYILNERKTYNETKGEKGAFVVATNSSWGIDEVFGTDFPIWCAVYDSLGTVGILNVGATTNRAANVDEVGDLPTTCPSDFLIAVTGSNRFDELGDEDNDEFGFGPINIDLAAPGASIISPSGIDGYNTGSTGLGQNGTSFATPMVTGAIGLLYAAPCYNFAARAQKDPAGTALEVRSLILDNVKVLDGWADKVASGGRLDVGKSLQALMTDCGCPTPYNIQSTASSETSAVLDWTLLDSIQNTDARIRALGTDDWMMMAGVASGLELSELSSCTTYEVQFAATCPSSTSEFSESYTFTTEGCCKPPENVLLQNLGIDFIEITWDSVMGAETYAIRYQAMGADEWLSLTTDTNFLRIDSLAPCTDYHVEFITNCPDIEPQGADTVTIRTFGCTDCDIENYCESFGTNAEDDWLEAIYLTNELDSLVSVSGSNGGYKNFALIDTLTAQLAEDEKYELTVIPGFSYTGGTSSFLRAWIDYNFDGDFDDAGEMIFDTPQEVDTAITQSFFVPMLDSLGHTMLRVMMKSNFGEGVNKIKPAGCDTFAFGEVEDYCIELVESKKICPEISGFEVIENTGNSLLLEWDTVVNDITYLIRWKDIDDDEDGWSDNMVPESDTSFMITGLKTCTEYQVQMISICQVDSSSSYEEIIMTNGTNCPVSNQEIESIYQWRAVPNPFNQNLRVIMDLSSPIESLSIEIMDIQGRILFKKPTQRFSPGQHVIQFDETALLAQGFYFIRLQSPEGVAVKKVIKN